MTNLTLNPKEAWDAKIAISDIADRMKSYKGLIVWALMEQIISLRDVKEGAFTFAELRSAHEAFAEVHNKRSK